ncbi:MAG: hypothetical protein V4673_08160 [Pseudomonadota bacterium]
MAYILQVNKDGLKRCFAVYVAIAKKQAAETLLYVGKVGDNRAGCNPMISRCGNHFSYNDKHSQIRKKITDHEEREFTFVFDHFEAFDPDEIVRKRSVDQINEIERQLNKSLQSTLQEESFGRLLNPFLDRVRVTPEERSRRKSLIVGSTTEKIDLIIDEVRAICTAARR